MDDSTPRKICFLVIKPIAHRLLSMHAFRQAIEWTLLAGRAMVPEHIARNSQGIHLRFLRAIPRLAPLAAEPGCLPEKANHLLFAVVSG